MLFLVAISAIALPHQVGAAVDSACASPSLSIDTKTVTVEGELLVTGQNFGTKCYDEETPPLGEGVLGLPNQDIEIVMTQSDAAILVARGNAGNDYNFVVTVKLPPEFTTGVLTVTARYMVADSVEFSEFTYPSDIVVTAADGSPETMESGSIASFGPEISEDVFEQTMNRATYFWFFLSVVLFGMWYRVNRKKLH